MYTYEHEIDLTYVRCACACVCDCASPATCVCSHFSSMQICIMSKFNEADFCSAVFHLHREDPLFANAVPVQTLRRFAESAHANYEQPDYEIAYPILDAQIGLLVGKSHFEKFNKLVLLMQREQFRRVVLGPLERKLQLNQGALHGEYHDFTKKSRIFHGIFQRALQELPQDDPLKALLTYEVMNKALLLGVQSPEKLQRYCCGLCTDNHSLLQPLLDFIQAIETELQLQLNQGALHGENMGSSLERQLQLNQGVLHGENMGSSLTIPAISADGVMQFPLPAHPPQAQFHEEQEKGHKEKKQPDQATKKATRRGGRKTTVRRRRARERILMQAEDERTTFLELLAPEANANGADSDEDGEAQM